MSYADWCADLSEELKNVLIDTFGSLKRAYEQIQKGA